MSSLVHTTCVIPIYCVITMYILPYIVINAAKPHDGKAGSNGSLHKYTVYMWATIYSSQKHSSVLEVAN